jgi:hypothetical protein
MTRTASLDHCREQGRGNRKQGLHLASKVPSLSKVRSSGQYSARALRWGAGFVGGGLSSLPLHLLNLFLVLGTTPEFLGGQEGGRAVTFAPRSLRRDMRYAIVIGGPVRDSRGFKGRESQHRTGLQGALPAKITLERGRARTK